MKINTDLKIPLSKLGGVHNSFSKKNYERTLIKTMFWISLHGWLNSREEIIVTNLSGLRNGDSTLHTPISQNQCNPSPRGIYNRLNKDEHFNEYYSLLHE